MTKTEMQAEIESLRAQLPTPPEPPAPIASKALDTGAALRTHIINTTCAVAGGVKTGGSAVGNFFRGLTVGKPKCSD